MKYINSSGDYYYCSNCNTWHKFTGQIKDLGTRHVNYFDKEKTNEKNADYYYCSNHRKWHSHNRSCIKYKLEIDVQNEILNKYKNLQPEDKTNKKQGSFTVQLGQKLHKWLFESSNFKVYYDHGDRNLPEVGEAKSIMITNNEEKIELSDVDIIILDENRKIRHIIEAEESSSTPKTIFGDIFTLILSKQMKFQSEEFDLENIVLFLIICTHSDEVRKKTKKIIDEIRKINEILRKEKISNSIEKIELIILNSKYELPVDGFEEVKYRIKKK